MFRDGAGAADGDRRAVFAANRAGLDAAIASDSAGLPGAESSERSDNELGDSQSEHIRGATRLDLVLALAEKVVALTS